MPVDFSNGIGDGMVLTCVDNGNGLQFECRTPGGGGFSLPYSNTVNLNSTMFAITNTNSTPQRGMQVDHAGRYGVHGIGRQGQANFNTSALNSTSFTFPAALYGEHLNS
ncbi:MAG: hypothetical protein JNK89_06745 [Saprospiraceae bacterium]|nr:hypothetical protein [Saprospiraceae bacterium]